MTQEELKLLLDALKFCHGGEPCGTAEAIAVVEKALANVATNDTSKEYVDEMQKQRHEQEPVAFEWDEDTDPIGEVVGFIEGSNYIMVKVHDGKQISLNDDLYDTPPQQKQELVATVDDNSQKWAGMDGAIAFHLIERHADNLDDIRKMMGEWLSANTPQRTEQEPVAWVWVNNKGWLNYGETPHDMFKSSPLYPHPPQRKWVGLTGGEISNMFGDWPFKYGEFAEAIEARLKEKNGYAEEKNT